MPGLGFTCLPKARSNYASFKWNSIGILKSINIQGSKGISQWPINCCTPIKVILIYYTPPMIHKINLLCRSQLVDETFAHSLMTPPSLINITLNQKIQRKLFFHKIYKFAHVWYYYYDAQKAYACTFSTKVCTWLNVEVASFKYPSSTYSIENNSKC